MTAAVHDCDHDNIRILDSEVHTEWESLHERAACCSMHERVSKRLLCNGGECSERFIQKLVTEPAALLLVPGRGSAKSRSASSLSRTVRFIVSCGYPRQRPRPAGPDFRRVRMRQDGDPVLLAALA